MLQRFMSLLLLPFFTRALTPQEYGVVALVSLIGVAMSGLFTSIQEIRWGCCITVSRLRELLEESIGFHGRSDVPVGSYVSGGIDSSLIYKMARSNGSASPLGFHGRSK